MRGRMWVLLLLLLLEGVFCLLVGISHDSLGATVRGAALLGELLKAASGSGCRSGGVTNLHPANNVVLEVWEGTLPSALANCQITTSTCC